MAGRDGKKQVRKANAGRRLLVGAGTGASVFFAAAAMATGSAVTAAPAHADFEDLLDPIIQPLLTSLTDSLTAIDPAAAVDITSWSDSLLSSLGSIDLALPSTAESAAAVGASAEPAAATGGTIPITIAENTEPTLTATVDGANTTLLADTGSSGLVIPWEDLGSTNELQDLLNLGLPSGFSESGFGGVDYFYLTYDNLPVDYDGGLDTTAPVEVEVFSFPTSLSSGETLTQYFDELSDNGAFTSFLSSNDVNGILGIGASGGAGESPLEAAGYNVTVDLPAKELIASTSNPGTAYATLPISGSTVTTDLTETVTNSSGAVVGTGSVSDDLDSGGVYGTIPSSIAPDGVPDGDTITVSDGTTQLYSYTVENNGVNQLPDETPTVVSGSSIDSGYEAFENNPVYIDYANDTLYYDDPVG